MKTKTAKPAPSTSPKTIISIILLLALIIGITVFVINKKDAAPQGPANIFVSEDGDNSENPANSAEAPLPLQKTIETEVMTYQCSEEYVGTIIYGVIPNAVIFSNDGETATLQAIPAASGVKYSNADESFIFHQKGEVALIQIDGEVMYSECVLQQRN